MGCSRAIVSSSTRTYYSLDHACGPAYPRLSTFDTLTPLAIALAGTVAFVLGFLQIAAKTGAL